MDHRGILLIVSSPSGAGKTTLIQRLLAEFEPQLEFSVSYTTRKMRRDEIDGRHYWFVTPYEFDTMASNLAFVEEALVFGNRYGTARDPVESALAAGRDTISDVNWQGASALAAHWPHDTLKVFILPPSLDVLERRLRARGSETRESINHRLVEARDDLAHFPEYQHLIVNDDLEHAYQLLRAIYITRRFGSENRSDVSYPLRDLAGVVGKNSTAEAHAARLLIDKSGQ